MIFDLQRYVQSQSDQKALPDSRFFHSDAPLSTYMPGKNPNEDGLLSQKEASRHLQAYGGEQAVDWVMDAVSLYADTTAHAAWHVEDDKGNKVENPDGRFMDLLDEPNPYMDYIELIELLVIDILLVGNAYWFKWQTDATGKPLALYRMCPEHIKVHGGKQGVDYYLYQPPGARDPMKIQPNELIHFKRPNPHSAYYGLGVIQGGGRPFDLELASTDSAAHYYENRADPSLIVESDRRIPRDVFNKLRQQLRARASNPRNAGELLLLEAGLKANTLSPSASQSLYDTIGPLSMKRILAMFRVHPKLLGYSTTDAASDKISDIRREFDNHVMRPFMNKIQTKVTMELAAAWGYDWKIDYTYTMAPEDALKLAGQMAMIPGMTPKEIRAFLIQSGFTIISDTTGDAEADKLLLALPGNEAGANGFTDGGFADGNLPGEPGRPPKPSSTKAIPRGGSTLPPGSKARRPAGKALTWAEVLEAAGELEGKSQPLPGEQRPQDPAFTQRVADVDALTASTEQMLREAVVELERGLLDETEGKAFNGSDLVKRLRGLTIWKTFQDKVEAILRQNAEQAAASASVHLGGQGFIPDEDLDYAEIAKSVVNRPEGIRGILRTLKASILGEVKDQRSDLKEAQAAIQSAVKEWSDGKAGVVALTEMTEAYNEATLSTLEALGHEEVFVEDGRDFDEPCIEADGQTWAISKARQHRTEHPNCRRAFLALPSVA